VLSEAVAGAAHHHGLRPAVVLGDRAMSWAEVHLAAEAMAPLLAARGVGRGSVVALALPSGPEWVVAATAVDRVGAVIAGISPVATAPERSAMVEAVAADLVLAGPGLVEGLPLRTEVVEMSVGGLVAEPGAPPPPVVPDHDRSGSRGYAVCFTSGTTGAPKAAAFSVDRARAVQRIDVGPDLDAVRGTGAPMIASTQFAHVGFVLKLPWYAALGCTLHVMPRWRADDAVELLAAHRMPALGVVAPQLALILRSPLLDERDLSALRLVIAGGAPSPPALVAEARERLGVDYSIRWSSTESGGVGLAALVDDAHPEAVGTIGTPRPGVSARVADADGRALPDGEVGELQLLSPATMDGYLGEPGATAAAFTGDGWLRTGDLVSVRGDGRFVLAGRAGDMYIRGGYNVHPAEVEAVLGTHPCVEAVAVVPRADEVMGEVGVAVVVTAAGCDPPTLADLRAHGAPRLARHKLPEAVVHVPGLPLTDAAKLDRRALARTVRR